MENLQTIYNEIKPLLTAYVPPMVITTDYGSRLELYTDKPVEIAGRKRPNLYFAAIIIQSKYVGFYFMPVYTDVEIKDVFEPDLLKLLKGKSCFHIKKSSPELLDHIRKALKIGFEKYQQNGWI